MISGLCHHPTEDFNLLCELFGHLVLVSVHGQVGGVEDKLLLGPRLLLQLLV